jgi:hypothetical protein
MATQGKVELLIKFSEYPAEVATVTHGWKEFKVESGGRFFVITVKPGVFKKLDDAKANYPEWVAAVGGQLGPQNGETFTVLNPNIQVFEKKPKEAKTPSEASNPPKP